MLVLAAFWETGESTRGGLPPEIDRYVASWGRPGDFGLLGVIQDHPVAAAWYRLFPAEEAGYGFVAEDVPEITIAVQPQNRGRGVGSALLRELLSTAQRNGYRSLSLSVSPRNPALRMYQRLGFVRVGESGDSWTMQLVRLGNER